MDGQEERIEEPGTGIDLGGEGGEDPWDSTADPLAEDGLPPGVEPGELGGDNPSEEPEEEAALEDPDNRDAAPDEEDYPPAVAEGEGDGEGAAPTEEAGEPSTGVEASAEAEEEAAVAEGAEAAEAEEPQEEKPKRKKSSRRKGTKKLPTGQRGYVILRQGENPGEWLEAFERTDPEVPFVLIQRNSTAALRKAYRLLAEHEEEPQSYVLNAVPEKLWKPREVSGRIHKQTAISVG